MTGAQHTPGPRLDAGIDLSLRIGQHVRHRDYAGKRVTGVVQGLCVDSENVLHADIVLDAPIVLPALREDDHELRIHRQHVPAHELAPFDDRDELIAVLLEALQAAQAKLLELNSDTTFKLPAELRRQMRDAIVKTTGDAS